MNSEATLVNGPKTVDGVTVLINERDFTVLHGLFLGKTEKAVLLAAGYARSTSEHSPQRVCRRIMRNLCRALQRQGLRGEEKILLTVGHAELTYTCDIESEDWLFHLHPKDECTRVRVKVQGDES